MNDDTSNLNSNEDFVPVKPPAKSKLLMPVLALVVLVVGLGIGMRLSQQQQRPTPSAMVAEGAASLSFSGSNTVQPDSDLVIDINVSAPETVSDATVDGITAIRAEVIFDNRYLSLTSGRITTNLSGWVYPVIEMNVSGNTTTLNINGIYLNGSTDGYTGAASAAQKFASLRFLGQSQGASQLAFGGNSQVLTKLTNIQVLGSSQPFSYTVGSVATATPTQAANPTATPTTVPGAPTVTPTLVPAASSTPTPTTGSGSNNGATNACGGTCGSNNNCNAGLICYSGFCRNPSCSTVASCTCSGPTSTPTVRPTARPTTVVATPTPTTKIVNYVEPTIVSDNPFLGGTPRTDVDVPDINYQDNTPIAKPNFFVTLLQWIIKFLRSLFGFR